MKTLMAAAAALVFSASVAQAWDAFAINDYGYGYGYGDSDQESRVAAIQACKNDSGTNYECYHMVTSIEDDSWTLVVIRCNGVGATGASQRGFAAAKWVAANKIGYQNRLGRCQVLDRVN